MPARLVASNDLLAPKAAIFARVLGRAPDGRRPASSKFGAQS
jgi:hypothetical protein